jgi:hypothetical protein
MRLLLEAADFWLGLVGISRGSNEKSKFTSWLVESAVGPLVPDHMGCVFMVTGLVMVMAGMDQDIISVSLSVRHYYYLEGLSSQNHTSVHCLSVWVYLEVV